MRSLFALPGDVHGAGTLRELSDAAVLCLLVENGPRRAEVVGARVGDFSPADHRLSVSDKAYDSQRESASLSAVCAAIVSRYLLVAGHKGKTADPLFRNLDHRPDKRGRA